MRKKETNFSKQHVTGTPIQQLQQGQTSIYLDINQFKDHTKHQVATSFLDSTRLGRGYQ
jgi:hypothetical protein